MFIELTDKQSNSKMLINLNKVIMIFPNNNGCWIHTDDFNNGNSLSVLETYEEIQNIILEIEKGIQL